MPLAPAASTWLPAARLIDVPGCGELFVRDSGEPLPAVLLLHGWMATADVNFFGLYQALHGRRRIIAPDHRGHGRSFLTEDGVTMRDCAADAIAVLDALEIERATIVGYSMGAAIAQLLVAEAPDRVDGLVLSGAALRWNVPSQKVGVRVGGWLGAVQRLRTGHATGVALARRASATSPLAAAWAPWLVRELERGHPGDLRSAGRDLARHDGRSLVPALRRVETQVVATSGDHLVPPRRQRELVRALGVDPVVVGADHDAPVALAEPWSAAISAAVEQVTAGPVITAAR